MSKTFTKPRLRERIASFLAPVIGPCFEDQSSLKEAPDWFQTSLFGLMLKQLWRYRGIYIIATLSLYGLQKIQSWIPFFAKDLANQFSGVSKIDSQISLKFVLILLGCGLGIIFLRTMSRHLFFYPARLQQLSMGLKLIESIEKTLPRKYEKFDSGQIYQMMMNDIDQVRAFIGFAVLQILNLTMALAVLIPALYRYRSDLVIALSPIFFVLFIFSFAMAKIRTLFKLTRDQQTLVQQFLIESYDGKETIQTFSVENDFINGIQKLSRQELQTFWRSGMYTSLVTPLIPLGVGAAFLWGAIILKGPPQSTASDLILFGSFVFLFLEPMRFVAWIGVVIAQCYGSWSRLQEFCEALKVNDPESSEKKISNGLSIELWNKEVQIPLEVFNFKQNNHDPAFLGVVGETGSGKSYLMEQISNFFIEQKKAVSLVRQNPYLFNMSLEKNIFLGREANSSELLRARHWIEVFELDHLVDREDKSEKDYWLELFSLEVGENGKKLSGGQAKRVCLIRSLMSLSDFILWDDPFSSVDVETEDHIWKELRKKNSEELKNKNFIITSHRLTTVKKVDNIILVDKTGRLISDSPDWFSTETGEIYHFFRDQILHF